MKKAIFGLFLAAVLLMQSICSAAEFRPTGIKESCYMKINAYSTKEYKYRKGTNWSYKDCGLDNHAIYVRHYVPHSTTPFTNLFKVCKVDSEGNTLGVYGEKWCTPGQNIPIQSDEIVMNEYYTVTARGNTLHYEYDGVKRVELRVNMYVNMNEIPKEKPETTDDDLDHAIFD